jgi:hypothetical protein
MIPAAKTSRQALTAHSRVETCPPRSRWMAGRAVTTMESRVTMKKATEVRSSAQPVLVGCLGAMARVGDIDCLCQRVLGLLALFG